jgi:hypothetical protein
MWERVNIVEILCIHVPKWKMRPVETIPGMGGGRVKENDGGDEFIVRTFINIYCKTF